MNTKNLIYGSKTVLNDNQERALSAALRVFEEMLFDIELILQHKSYQGFLQEVEDDIAEEIKERIVKKISESKDCVDYLTQQFSLERRVETASRQLSGKLVYCFEVLEDVKSKRLKGYGKVADGLDGLLDPQLNQLIKLISEIVMFLRETP